MSVRSGDIFFCVLFEMGSILQVEGVVVCELNELGGFSYFYNNFLIQLCVVIGFLILFIFNGVVNL